MTAIVAEPVVGITTAIDTALCDLIKVDHKRLTPDEVRSLLGDICTQLRCWYLDLPSPLNVIALREANTSKSGLVDALLEVRYGS